MIPLAAAGLLAGRHLMRPDRTVACYLVTDSPEADVAVLLRLLHLGRAGDVHVSALPVAPVAQDFTLIIDGRPIDPATDPAVSSDIASFARQVRRRPGDAHRIIAIERASPSSAGVVCFEVDGVTREVVPVDKCYRRIDITGVAGNTAFRLDDGRLSVVEASCRHALCRKMRGQTSGRIICAPNRLVATLPRPQVLIDAVSG
jgi:hypothetical protein